MIHFGPSVNAFNSLPSITKLANAPGALVAINADSMRAILAIGNMMNMILANL